MAASRTKLRWMAPLLALFGLLLFVYFAGYLLVTRNWTTFPKPSGGTIAIRSYNRAWQAKFFKPAAKFEGFLFGKNATTAWEERLANETILHDE